MSVAVVIPVVSSPSCSPSPLASERYDYHLADEEDADNRDVALLDAAMTKVNKEPSKSVSGSDERVKMEIKMKVKVESKGNDIGKVQVSDCDEIALEDDDTLALKASATSRAGASSSSLSTGDGSMKSPSASTWSILSKGGCCNQSNLLVLDWDDTILPTSYLLSNNESESLTEPLLYRHVWQEMHELDLVVWQFLAAAVAEYGLSNICIITSAKHGWVEFSSQLYLPRAHLLIGQLSICSARHLYEQSLLSPSGGSSSTPSWGRSAAGGGVGIPPAALMVDSDSDESDESESRPLLTDDDSSSSSGSLLERLSANSPVLWKYKAMQQFVEKNRSLWRRARAGSSSRVSSQSGVKLASVPEHDAWCESKQMRDELVSSIYANRHRHLIVMGDSHIESKAAQLMCEHDDALTVNNVVFESNPNPQLISQQLVVATQMLSASVKSGAAHSPF